MKNQKVRDNAIFNTVRENNLTGLQRLLNSGASPNAIDSRGAPILHIAAQLGYEKIVKQLLLHQDIKCNIKILKSFTAIHLAAQEGHTQVIEEFLNSEKVNSNARSNDDFTPLHYAAQEGHAQAVKKLLANPKVNHSAKDLNGFTALHLAAQYGHVAAIKEILLHKSINANNQTNRGVTPLHLAVHSCNPDAVEELLSDKSININAQDVMKISPLHLAASIPDGNPDAIKKLLSYKTINPNLKDSKGNSPLHLAAYYGHVSLVKELMLNADIDANSINIDKLTPLDFAVDKGSPDVLEPFLTFKVIDSYINLYGHTKLAIFFDKAMQIMPLLSNAAYYVQNGKSESEKVFNTNATNFYKKAVEFAQNDKCCEIYIKIGDMMHIMQQHNSAIKFYKKVLEEYKSMIAYHNMGCAQMAINDNKNALKSFNQALELEPNRADLHASKGRALKKLNQWDEALESLHKAIDLAPKNKSFMALEEKIIQQKNKLFLSRSQDTKESYDDLSNEGSQSISEISHKLYTKNLMGTV